MSEELLQRDLIANPTQVGKWHFYNIGSTTIKALKEYNIIRNVDYGAVEKKKVDGIITHGKNVIAIIENKKPTQFNTQAKQERAIAQEIEVAKRLDCKLLIATDTKESIWVNALTGNRIKDESGKEIKIKFDINDEKVIALIEKINYSINELNDNLKPKQLVNPTDLAKQIWQDIWSVSGATPENCLYTFVELFIFKYLSDLGVLQGVYNFATLVSNFDSNTSEEILETYASTIRPKIKQLFPENPIDKTTIINGTIFVTKDQKAVKGYSTVFKKVLTKFKDYGKLEHIDYDFKSQLFESFLKESISKKNWGQFFTPLKVVRAVVEMAKDQIKEGVKICDPACGVGKFLLEPIITKLDQFYEIQKGRLIPKITIHGYDKGFDKDEQKTIILAKANMLIYFSDLIKENTNITKEFAKLFNDSFILKTNSILGTLSEPVENEYDLIVTNPPYVTSGSSNLKEEIKKDGTLVNYYKINAIGVEGLFMEWIIRALKPDGKAFVIVPDGIFNRQNDRNLRQFVTDECYIDAIISLPVKTFFTTPKKTYILCLTKKANKKNIQTDPVFTYLVSEIGESRDVYRFDIDQDDLTEAVTLYSFFKGNKSEFDKINSDKRCKIQSFDRFSPDSNWSVERWWTKEEQIELGIIGEDTALDINEFSDLVSDISGTLSEFSNLLKEVSEKKKQISEYQDISLSNRTYFELSIGKRVVKRDIYNISGTIPIYSANVREPVGFHTKSNLNNFNNNFVLWGIDGDFEFNTIRKNNPFVSTDHCGTIRILDDSILPEYLMIQLEKVKHKYGFDRGLRASLKNMQLVSVAIPFTNGQIDVAKQKEVIEKYEYISELKDKVTFYKSKIQKLIIDVTNDTNTVMFKITDLFQILGEENITKKYINANKGKYPVYSGQLENEGVFGYIDTYKYDEDLLTWVTYGNSGHIKEISGKLNIGRNNCGLRPLSPDIDLSYIKFIAQPIFIANIKGDKQKSLPQTIVKNLEIPVPVDAKGNYDLQAQKEIANQIKKIDEIKTIMVKELTSLINTTVDIE